MPASGPGPQLRHTQSTQVRAPPGPPQPTGPFPLLPFRLLSQSTTPVRLVCMVEWLITDCPEDYPPDHLGAWQLTPVVLLLMLKDEFLNFAVFVCNKLLLFLLLFVSLFARCALNRSADS